MKAFLRLLFSAALLLAPLPVGAQSTANNVISGHLSTLSCPSGFTVCFRQQYKAIAGTQSAVDISSATALTIPTGAIRAVITFAGTNNGNGVCAFYRDDGTSPTGTTGIPVPAFQPFAYDILSLPIKAIQATGATCTMSVAYYG